MRIKCFFLKEKLSRYVDDNLNAGDIKRVEAHISGCPDCALKIADYKKLSGKFKTDPERAPEYLWTRIEAGLNDGIKEKGFFARVLIPNFMPYLAAAVVLILFTVSYVKRPVEINSVSETVPAAIQVASADNGVLGDIMLGETDVDSYIDTWIAKETAGTFLADELSNGVNGDI